MCRKHLSLLGWGGGEQCVCLCTGSLDRVCQDPVRSVVLGVVDEAVFDERQINPWNKIWRGKIILKGILLILVRTLRM